MTRVSVIVNNFNYERYLREAIDSALAQDHPGTEVVVVDDGSTDGSATVIESYGDAVVPVLKDNGGQASAFNAGFAASGGDVVVFLDADDRLRPSAAREAVSRLAHGEAAKAHWPLALIDADGEPTAGVIPPEPLRAGDLREELVRGGPFSLVSPPTSGNAWTRDFLERVLPMPEEDYRLLADCYLLDLAPLFGSVELIDAPLTDYRVHGENRFWHSFDAQLWRHAELPRRHAALLQRFCRRLGIDADPERWRLDPWWEALEAAATTIARTVPAGASFVLIDDCRWGMDEFEGRRALPFPERDGHYAGPPADDLEAVRELERTLASGVPAVVVGWPAFWWLDTYPQLRAFLLSDLQPVAQDDRVAIFEARSAVSRALR